MTFWDASEGFCQKALRARAESPALSRKSDIKATVEVAGKKVYQHDITGSWLHNILSHVLIFGVKGRWLLVSQG